MTDQGSLDELPAQQPKTNRMFLVFGWVLIVLSPLLANMLQHYLPAFLALVLGVIGAVLVIIAKERSLTRTALMTVALIGLSLFASIFLHDFLVFGGRAQQAEAKSNLRIIYELELTYYNQHKKFGNFTEIGFKERSSRYTLRIDRSGTPGTVIFPKGALRFDKSGNETEYPVTPDNTMVPAGISISPLGFTATATGDIDDDPTIDQWHINDHGQGLHQADVNDIPYGKEWVVALLTNSDNR